MREKNLINWAQSSMHAIKNHSMNLLTELSPINKKISVTLIPMQGVAYLDTKFLVLDAKNVMIFFFFFWLNKPIRKTMMSITTSSKGISIPMTTSYTSSVWLIIILSLQIAFSKHVSKSSFVMIRKKIK